MKKIIACFFLSIFCSYSQITEKDSLNIIDVHLEEIVVSAFRASDDTPVTYSEITREELRRFNIGQDIPTLLKYTPGIITHSDSGNGIGYSAMHIRGSDETRINVTINGIPLNDAESLNSYWVDIPDLSSSINSIQIQRGVGTSTNGASAFGASVNLKTTDLNKDAYIRSNNTFGSYKTLKNNVEFGTGLFANKFAFDGRFSQISSDGYIDRATSNLKSFYLSASYSEKNEILKAIIFYGHERTYQAWYGVPLNYLDSARTYNSYVYDNEIDNYGQTHYQLHYSKKVYKNTNVTISAHYTHGEGYYEQFRSGEDLVDYGLENILIGNDTIASTDLIRRKWLNNDFGGVVFSANHKMDKLNLTFGGASNRYSGQHYGNIMWAEYASNGNYDREYYKNIATKFDHNLYLKSDYSLSTNTNLYADFQKRKVEYQFIGNDQGGNATEQTVNLDFFNPKVGIHHSLNANQALYASFAVANREPNRNDFVESTPKLQTAPTLRIITFITKVTPLCLTYFCVRKRFRRSRQSGSRQKKNRRARRSAPVRRAFA